MKFLLIILFFVTRVLGQTSTDNSINYKIKPIPAPDRTNLEISVNFKTNDNTPVNIKLPTDYFGTPNLYRFVISFNGRAGTTVKTGEKENERIIYPNENGNVSLEYVLSYDPKLLENNTYSPNVSPTHFHLAGCQWLLQIGEAEQKQQIKAEFINVPKDWQTYSSLSPNPSKFEINVSFQDLITTAIGGGKGGFRQFKYKNKPVSVFIRGKFDVSNQEIFDAVQKIVILQRNYFNDESQDFYNIVILPKEENIAGVRFENMFISFFKKDVTRDQLYLLMAHEMSHNWFKSDIIRPKENESGLRFAWFYEGVNEYFARKILLEGGLIELTKFIELINRDIVNIADNPHHSATFDDLIEATKNRKYDQAFNKLSYYRGALIAFIWDTQIHDSYKNRSLSDFVREVSTLAQKNGGISEEELFKLAEKFGVDAKKDFEKYILRGESINFEQDLFKRKFTLANRKIPSFDPGFSINESYKNKKITEVEKDKAAYRAGLRNEMELVSIKNANRFGNAWEFDKPLSVTVKIDGKEKIFEYFPHGEMLNVLQFQLKK